jgi:iron-sulfur cluster repair protein YtfE (RIC family)
MKDALEIINSVLAQHSTITDHITDAGNKMNDIDAIFNVQRETYKVAWNSSSVTDLLENRNQLREKIQVLEDGLAKHFAYEETVFPLILGEILLKDILSDHGKVSERIEKVKSCLNSLEGLDKDELYAKRTELLESVNDLSDTITSHAHSEDRVLTMIKKVFEEYAEDKG